MRMDNRRVVVVGHCASGKSTIAAALRAAGIDASACAQEHSEIPTLWKHTAPAFLVFLDVDLATVRVRRSPDWPESIYLIQQRRLANARSAADVVIDTALYDVDKTVGIVQTALFRRNYT
jgi:energy-coupling factor transporter ATP-binding protein EcfA2